MSPLLLAALLAVSGAPDGARPPARGSRAPAPPASHAAPVGADPLEHPENPSDPETARILAQAKVYFDAGTAHYAAGRFQEAIKSFQAGYSLVPRPSFLVNIGQAYRKLGDLVSAKEAYVAYVRALPENSAIRDQALQVLAEIELQLHDPASAAMGVTPRVGSAAPPVAVTTPPRAGTSRAASWLGLSFGGAGLALVGTGVGFQLRARSASDSLAEASRRGDAFDPNEERAGKRAEKIGNGLFFAGGAVMAAGLLIFLVVDAAGPTERAGTGVGVAVAPVSLGVSWRF